MHQWKYITNSFGTKCRFTSDWTHPSIGQSGSHNCNCFTVYLHRTCLQYNDIEKANFSCKNDAENKLLSRYKILTNIIIPGNKNQGNLEVQSPLENNHSPSCSKQEQNFDRQCPVLTKILNYWIWKQRYESFDKRTKKGICVILYITLWPKLYIILCKYYYPTNSPPAILRR